MVSNYSNFRGDAAVKLERIYFVEIVGATNIFYELTYLIDYSTLESDSVSPLKSIPSS